MLDGTPITIQFSQGITTIISNKYAYFLKNGLRRISSPHARALYRMQMATNARNVASFHGKTISYENNFKGSTYAPWNIHRWVVTYYDHWYFGGIVKKTKTGTLVFVVKDAVYEGDYHNDTLTSKPYDESKVMVGGTLIKESVLRNMVQECIKEVLQEECKCDYKLGPYECVYGTFRKLLPDSLPQFGWLNDIMMYFSPSQTYCLFRQDKSHKYFFTKIVDAPELGKDETKFVLVKPKDVPSLILRDAKALIRTEKNQRTEIS